ncbi:heme peroxidase [Mycena floridula]|nr:heme peroxidase [Mycena floridula]
MAQITPIQGFELGADAAYLASRPLPTAPDWPLRLASPRRRELATRRPTLAAFLESTINPDDVDDRKGAFEAGLTLLSKIPSGSPCCDRHGQCCRGNAAALLGPVHAFRQADGGGNNLQIPELGKAGTAYARSVQTKWCVPPSALPDPGLVFDTLLKRKQMREHPGGNSSLTFAFASLVTHSLFRTDYKDWNINNTSSYLDLSPVYGINQAAQDLVRDKAQGRGLLYPDTFSEERLLLLPPAASALLVILSRNHNYVATMLLKINERKKWSDPPPTDPALRAAQDEEIFQTARLINGGHFMSLIMGDYVAGFLGLSEGNAWNMNAFDPIKNKGVEVERGQGNHCSVEFNVLYRWHATTSAADEKWTADFFNKTFNNKPFDQLTLQDFGGAFMKILGTIEKDPSKRSFGGLVRGPDGKFSDDKLAEILHNATENPAGAYGAQGTPACLRVIEMMGIMQARQWGVCTMNEFRKFLGLKQFTTFEEWNPDPEVAGAARRLYGHVNNLELYTGLQCESTMPLAGGLRFSCGYTMTRAVLGDAIALVRGDRFYTTSFTPANLTTWGYQDTIREPNNGGFGGEMPKLLMRHLPRHYPFNSTYGCFPFFTPAKMKDSLTRQGIADRYTFTRPVAAVVPKVLNTFTGIKYVFDDPVRFPNVYDMKGLGNGYGFILAFDEAKKHDADKALAMHALFPTPDSLDAYRAWYRESITTKILERSWKYDGVQGAYVDIVRDVINATSVHWAADRLCGLPLKTQDNPHGLYTEQEIYDMFTTLFQLTFLAIGENEHGFALRYTAVQAGGVIQALIAKSVLEVAPGSAPNAIATFVSHVTNYIWPATASNVIDFYLDDSHAKERAEIIRLSKLKDAKSTELLIGYTREAMRLNPQFTGLWRDVSVATQIPQGDGLPALQVNPGDRIWASFKNAHRNQTITEILRIVFSLPNVRRAPGSAGLLGGGGGSDGTGFTVMANETETNMYLSPNGVLSPWPAGMTLVVSASFDWCSTF